MKTASLSGAFLLPMKTYYLQKNEKSTKYEPDRIFIDDHLHDGFKELNRCEAETWIEAKKKLIGKRSAKCQ